MAMTNEQIIHDLEALAAAFREERGVEPMCLGAAVKYIKELSNMQYAAYELGYRAGKEQAQPKEGQEADK